VLLQRLAHHLGRQAGLHVPQPRNLAVAVAQLQGVLLLDGGLLQLLFHHHQIQVVLEFIALPGHHRHRLGHCQPAHHLARLQLRLELLDLGVLPGGHALQLLRQPGLGQQRRCLLRLPHTPQLMGQRIALLVHCAQGLGHRQPACHLGGVQLGLQALNLGVFGGRRLLQFIGHLGLRQRYRIALVLLGQLQPLVQLRVEIRVAHLLEDVGIAGLVHLERLVAVGADDVVHGGHCVSCFVGRGA